MSNELDLEPKEYWLANGIKIIIPPMTNDELLEAWNKTKMAMDVLLREDKK
jgi:hypothetical protein